MILFVLYEVFKVRFVSGKIFLFPMGLSGLEPPTSRLSGVRSNHLSYKPILAGRFHDPLFDCGHILYPRGEYEIRTRDLLLARQALSQLS